MLSEMGEIESFELLFGRPKHTVLILRSQVPSPERSYSRQSGIAGEATYVIAMQFCSTIGSFQKLGYSGFVWRVNSVKNGARYFYERAVGLVY